MEQRFKRKNSRLLHRFEDIRENKSTGGHQVVCTNEQVKLKMKTCFVLERTGNTGHQSLVTSISKDDMLPHSHDDVNEPTKDGQKAVVNILVSSHLNQKGANRQPEQVSTRYYTQASNLVQQNILSAS